MSSMLSICLKLDSMSKLTELADVTFYEKVKMKYSNSNLNVEQSLNFILACIILNISRGIIINVFTPCCTVRSSYPLTMLTR